MTNYPYLWFKNISALLEKREYHTYNIFLFALFVGSVRRYLEWGFGGEYPSFPASNLLMLVGFYWFAFFLITSILRVLIPDQPWRVSINVILVGIFLGIFPPLIDLVVSGPGFEYSYVWGLPSRFNPLLYNPDLKIPIGEAVVLWAVIFLTSLYVFHKTRSVWRFLAAAAAAYLGVIVLGGFWAGMAGLTSALFAWPPTHTVALVNLFQFVGAILLYLFLQPHVGRALFRRSLHAVPFVMFVFVGSAFAGQISIVTVIYAGILYLMFATALVQNDHFDEAEDKAAGRSSYADLDDVRFFTISAACILATVGVANSIVVYPLLIVLVVSMLYSFPLYRGKQYFPANLKMEGMWGFSSFAVGVVAAIEYRAFEAPNWWIGILPWPDDRSLLGALDLETIWALLLVFGGYSMVAILKDYKDIDADRQAGVTTLYTLAKRRGWNVERVHLSVRLVSAGALLAVPVLLSIGERIAAGHVFTGLLFGASVFLLMKGKPSEGRFRLTLIALSTYFLYLALALTYPPA